MPQEITYPHAVPGDECQHVEKIGREAVVCGMPAVCVRVVNGRWQGLPLCRACYEEFREKERTDA